MKKTAQEIAQFLEGRLVGDGKTLIEGITNIETPIPGHITFIQDGKNLRKLEATDMACLIVPPSIQESPKPLIQVKNPKLAWAKLLRLFYPLPSYSKTVSEQASVAKSAKIGKDVTIEAFACIGESVEIGEGSVIRSHSYIGDRVKIGAETLIHPTVMIYEDCIIGNRVIIHASTVIGSDGFGYVATETCQEKVPQVGNVIIEDDVELGASVSIDRATVGSTLIKRGVKLDNQVQIAHNVVLGEHTVISAQSGVSGSSTIGKHVTMGGKVGVGDHCEMGDWSMAGAGAGLPTGKKVPPRQIVFGEPARPYQQARKQIGAQLRSAETYEEVKQLRKRVEALESQLARENAKPQA